LTLAFGFEFLDRLAMSFMLPLIQPELGITNTQIGLLGFVNTGFYAVSAIVFGYIQDKRGSRKKWLVFWLVLTFFATVATTFVSNFAQLLVVRSFVGIVEGPLLGLFGAILIQVNPRNFGRNYGMTNSGVGVIAVILGPVAITQIVEHLTWQYTYFLVAIPTIIIAALVQIFIKEVKLDPEEAKRQKEALIAAGGTKSLFKHRNIIVSMIFGIFMFGGYWTMMLYSSLYFTNVQGLSVQQMGFVTSFMGIFYVINNTLIPKLSDIFGRKPISIIWSAICILAPLSMALLPGTIFPIIFYVLFGGGGSAMVPINSGVIPMETVVEGLRTTANGVISGTGEFVGGALFPVLVGKIADMTSLRGTMGVGAGQFACCVIVALFLEESNKFVLEKRAAKHAAINKTAAHGGTV